MKNIGCGGDGAALPPHAAPAGSEVQHGGVIRLTLGCNDAGSDEVRKSRLRAISRADDLEHWDFNSECFCHQYHLMVAALLKFMDLVLKKLNAPFKFWSALAVIMHSWRDHCALIYRCWKSKDIVGAQDVKRVPPQPIIGRWGRASDCAKYLLKRPRAMLIVVLCEVLSKDKGAATGDGKEALLLLLLLFLLS